MRWYAGHQGTGNTSTVSVKATCIRGKISVRAGQHAMRIQLTVIAGQVIHKNNRRTTVIEITTVARKHYTVRQFQGLAPQAAKIIAKASPATDHLRAKHKCKQP